MPGLLEDKKMNLEPMINETLNSAAANSALYGTALLDVMSSDRTLNNITESLNTIRSTASSNKLGATDIDSTTEEINVLLTYLN